MKIIHTSDWHIGQDFYRYDRAEEHAAFFQQLKEIIKKEKPDALLVSGDIYHTALPSAAAQKLYTENMVKLHQACPEMVIVVTAGNHDSYTRLESAGKLWELAQVKVVGHINDIEESDSVEEKHIITITDKDNKEKGYIIAIPYTRDNETEIFKTAQKIVENKNRQNLPVIMMGHLAIGGANLEGHDEIARGGMDYVEIEKLGDYYDYLALGHIHCPQLIRGSQKARYSGSPIQVNFDENYPHSVSIIEINNHGEIPQIRAEKITNEFQFLTIPSEPKPFKEALHEFISREIPEKSYVCLNVKIKDFAPSDADLLIQNALQTQKCRFCKIKMTKEEKPTQERTRILNTEEIKNMEPVELASLYFKESLGEELDNELKGMIKEITYKVKENERRQP